jgi:hypothetical protein
MATHVILGSLKVDHEACANIVSVLTPCHGEITELKGAHYHKVVEITKNAGKCLEEEYLVSSHEKVAFGGKIVSLLLRMNDQTCIAYSS